MHRWSLDSIIKSRINHWFCIWYLSVNEIFII